MSKAIGSKKVDYFIALPLAKYYYYYYPTIRKIFHALTKCLRLTNPTSYVHDSMLPSYDRMHQVRCVVDIVRCSFINVWNLGKFLIINEILIGYKGSYCPAR